MATFNQRTKAITYRKKDNARTRILKQNPQARGWVNRVTIVTPRKPNSAKRPVVKVYMKKINRLTAHIPGIGHTLKKFAKILIRGRGPRDLPGVRYSGVRGVLDFIGLRKKKRRRSIYGAEQNDMSKIRARRKYRIAIRKAENERIRKENEESVYASEQTAVEALTFYKQSTRHISVIGKINKKNLFYFKNPIVFIEYRSYKKSPRAFLLQYCKYLRINSYYALFSYYYLFSYCKNYIFVTNVKKFELSINTNINKLVFENYIQSCNVAHCLVYPQVKSYYFCIFFDTYKFYYQQKTNYMKAKKDFYLPPKKRVKIIEQKTKLATSLQNAVFVRDRLVLNRISKKHEKAVVKLQSFNFFFLRNRSLFFKNLTKALKGCKFRNAVSVKRQFSFKNMYNLNVLSGTVKLGKCNNKKLRCL